MERRKLAAALSTVLIVLCASALNVFAADAVKVVLNGGEIAYDVPPQIIGGYTMVPVRATIEAITGSEMQWDEETKTITFMVGEATVTHVLGTTTVDNGGQTLEYPAPSQIIDSRMLVPVRMIAETSGCQVDWDADTRTVTITGGVGEAPEGTPAEQHPAEAPAEIKLEYDTLNVTGVALKDKPDEPNYIGYYWSPVISGVNEEFDAFASKYLADAVAKPVKEFEADYNDLRAAADQPGAGFNSPGDEDTADAAPELDLNELAARYNYMSKSFLLTTAEDYLAVGEVITWYTGGAHPMTIVKAFNFDIPGKKAMVFGDLFKAGYKAEIDKILADMAKTDEYKDKLFADAKPEASDDTNFFLIKDTLVVFFRPYDIGSYAAGFIIFEIPLSDIKDILKDNYATEEFTAQMGVSELFNVSFE